MRSSVRDAFVAFTAPLEGVVPHMYLDVKGLVTVAIGILIDPMGPALDMPFVRADGSPATRQEIGAEWRKMKSTPALAKLGWQAAAKLASIHLTPEGVKSVVMGKLNNVESFLKQRFPDWEQWPADAQLGVLSVSWAAGPGFHFPHFEAALHAQEWETCAVECHLDEKGNHGLVARNVANKNLFLNAARVKECGYADDLLVWPKIV